MDRQRQIDLMRGAEERASRSLQTWLQRPGFKESLKAKRPEDDRAARRPKRRACG